MQTEIETKATQVNDLRRLTTIRSRCTDLYSLALENRLEHFAVDESKMSKALQSVLDLIERDYASWDEIPFHSRWRHFQAGFPERTEVFFSELSDKKESERGRILWDLVIVSVLLDAGAGPQWTYYEESTGLRLGRSEGLGIASWHMFMAGAFSNDPEHDPWRVDGEVLVNLSQDCLARYFQVSPKNPLVGIEGRTEVLRRLGREVLENPLFAEGDSHRPGNLWDKIIATASPDRKIDIAKFWDLTFSAFENIWPVSFGRTVFKGKNLGDVWRHSAFPADDAYQGLVPFHKLSQWLCYSLLEPLVKCAYSLENLDLMTGLAEYRNGGLFIDTGVLVVKQASELDKEQRVDSEFVVEWRALTVALIDVLADQLRQVSGKTSAELPLVKILEGGTWKAGRHVASQSRPSGGPPFAIVSDGTVF